MANSSAHSTDLSVLSDVAPELAAAFASLVGEIALVIDDGGVIRNVAVGDSASGHPASSWVGVPWIDTVTAATRRKIELLLQDVAAPGVTRRREVNHPSSEGQDIPVAYTALRLGPAGPVIAVGRDLRAVAAIQQQVVDARRELERDYWKLRQEQTRQRVLAQVANDAVMVVDAASLAIHQSNAAAVALFGSPDAGLPAPIQDLLSMAARSGRAAEVRTRATPGGALIDLSATPFRVPVNGVPTHALLVRGRSAAEDEAGDAGAAVVLCDSSGRLRIANPAFHLLCRAGMQASEGMPLCELLGDPRRELAALLAQARRDGLVKRPALHLGGNGAPAFEIDATATLIADGDQECVGLVLERRVSSQGEDLGGSVGVPTPPPGTASLPELVQRAGEAAERAAIASALGRAAADPRVASGLLGISEADLAQRLARLGLTSRTP